MPGMRTLLATVGCLGLVSGTILAQCPACSGVVAQTKLELLRAQRNTLVVSGQSDPITVHGNNSSLTIVPMEVYAVATTKRLFGLHIRLTGRDGAPASDSYADHEEIDAVIAGLAGMGHIVPGMTRLPVQEAMVSTLTLVISCDADRNSIQILNPGGEARFRRDQAGELRKAFADAKEILDRTRL